MKKFSSFLIFLLVLNVFAGVGLAGYLVATGRLDKQKSLAILDLLKHQGTPDKLRDQVNDVLYPIAAPPAATVPATEVAPAESTADATLSSLATAQDRIDFARRAADQERLRLENEARNLLARQKLLEEQRVAITRQLDLLNADKKKFEDQVNTSQSRLKDENFQRTVALYNDLKPKQVKDLFMSLDHDLVADYFRAFDSEHATKLIAEFKTPEEKQYISAVLEKIRTTGTGPATAPSPPAAQTAANIPAKE